MLKLKKGRNRLIASGKTYLKGEEYKESDVNPKLLGYFDNTGTMTVEQTEPKVIYKDKLVEKIVPVFGAMTLDQLKGLEKAPLQILAMQYDVEIKGRPSNDEIAQLVFDAQPNEETEGEGDK